MEFEGRAGAFRASVRALRVVSITVVLTVGIVCATIVVAILFPQGIVEALRILDAAVLPAIARLSRRFWPVLAATAVLRELRGALEALAAAAREMRSLAGSVQQAVNGFRQLADGVRRAAVHTVRVIRYVVSPVTGAVPTTAAVVIAAPLPARRLFRGGPIEQRRPSASAGVVTVAR